ncbi:glycosyltransferase family A protein [Candidatus Nanopelagicus limnes]|nr:glycosyltransferase family 2 protein [Candidatus Nanopelagicus limnes]
MEIISNPIVFIGMPVYNSENTIRQTLESIVCQDYDEWKLLISDNFSTDLTREICQEFVELDDRITLHQQSENIGAWNNFIFVLEKSEGPYFKFQAADDVLSRDYLKSNVLELEVDSSILGSSSPDCWDWEYEEQKSPVIFELRGSQRYRLRTLRENCWRSNGLFYAIYRTNEIRNVITKEIFASKIAILDWLILARLVKAGNINRSKSGLMILGSNGASNSKELAWFNQLTSFRSKIFPYWGFFRLLKKSSGKLLIGASVEVLFWIIEMQLAHTKGLLWLILKKSGKGINTQ